jgi:hypothetical protein
MQPAKLEAALAMAFSRSGGGEQSPEANIWDEKSLMGFKVACYAYFLRLLEPALQEIAS